MPNTLKWEEQKYGGAETLNLAKGWIRIYVGWALTSKDEEGYYTASINGHTVQGKFKDIETAKRTAVKLAFKMTELAHEQLKNFLED